jgi:hypothetical protein
VGYNTSYYREPTALKMNFAISERAAPLGGKLILDFSKETRKQLSTVKLSCKTDIKVDEKSLCEFNQGRLITDLKDGSSVANKTQYNLEILGQQLPQINDFCQVDHLLPRVSLQYFK